MQQKIDVRFKINPKIYSFVNYESPLKKGDFVVVETSLGQGFGKVEKVEQPENGKTYKKVVRKATEEDISRHEANLQKEREAILKTKQLVSKLKLNMDIVNAELSFDGSKLLIDFIAEDRVDFRNLVKELATTLKTRIELHQIGIRDQAKMVGGIGICGRVCCCASHLKDFGKVSIKMAKVQGLALNPTKISGSCGRLMCCLEYENPFYSEVSSKMPKINSQIKTPDGIGTVVFQDLLGQKVSVKFENGDTSTVKEFPLEDILKTNSSNLAKDNTTAHATNLQNKNLNNKDTSSIKAKKEFNFAKNNGKNVNFGTKNAKNPQN